MSNDPLHGVTLQMMLEALEQEYGWAELAKRIRINCFANDPSIKSSLKFLRRTPWARAKVEALYVEYKIGLKERPRRRAETAFVTNKDKPNRDTRFIWPDKYR